MAHHARRLVAKNGMEDVVEVIQCSVEDLKLDAKVVLESFARGGRRRGGKAVPLVFGPHVYTNIRCTEGVFFFFFYGPEIGGASAELCLCTVVVLLYVLGRIWYHFFFFLRPVVAHDASFVHAPPDVLYFCFVF